MFLTHNSYWRRFLTALIAASIASTPCYSQQQASEESVKAAFLYNFTKFVEWPTKTLSASSADPFRLCISGETATERTLVELAKGRAIDGHPINVHHLKHDEDAGTCQVLFVSGNESRRTSHLLQTLNGASVLTVGESGDFIRSGGIIAFILDSSRVRFAINERAAEQAGIKISSKLLNLAVSVDR